MEHGEQGAEMSQSGNTTTSQIPQRALELRFLTRADAEVKELRASLPRDPLALHASDLSHLEKVAHRISSEAEAFGFPEIEVIAGGIELLALDRLPRAPRALLELAARLAERISALQVHVQHYIAERMNEQVPDELPMSAHLPGFGVRRR
jgi:HPt (histidine-containing phosphotransfer) domain-containing protein